MIEIIKLVMDKLQRHGQTEITGWIQTVSRHH
jgi:hypothetical protein